ncbi:MULTISPECIES: hypothetical protein [Metabacillus]|uniref:Uncharacterized protein n=2 Tax=Metabacillus TaxID=2675233 RepID=A0A179SUN7_9BACI|nr:MULTISPECIES: hypothetical protein [Metabacillus]OAS85345.1 hypothetical protein A6K24_24215 [Metabacillus litoralis]QNF29955.1 hypothetical protein HUW50_22175 [Metabacillus sp. KUDC1714]
MKEKNKDLDFLHEVAKKISERSKQGSPILPDEVFDLFEVTLETITDVRTIEMPIFMPFVIEKEDDFYTARCHVYRACRGIGFTEEEAIEKLKEDIDLYNKSYIKTEKKMQMEEIMNKIFPKDRF